MHEGRGTYERCRGMQCLMSTVPPTRNLTTRPSLARYPYASRPRAVETRPRAFESRPRAVESRPRGVESRPRGVESRPRGVESRPRAVESRPCAVESRPRAVESRSRAVESRPPCSRQLSNHLFRSELKHGRRLENVSIN